MATAVGAVGGMAHAPSKSGVWSWITTVDHKRIGILYGTTAVCFFLVGGVEALLIRLQLAEAEATLIGSGLFSQLFTMHALTMIFLAIMPLGACFFNFIVPLQIGARDVAFPRLNALSYWLFLFGALLLNSSFIFGGAPDAGWFAYANLTANEYSPSNAIDFFSLGMLVLGISSLAAALNFIITILNLRAPGMTLMRMPVFTWMTLGGVLPVGLRTAHPDGRSGAAALLARVRHAVLLSRDGRRPASVAAHLLALWAP